MSATLYQPDGRTVELQPSNGSRWTTEELSSLVEGTPETLTTTDGRMMVVNDSHRILGLELNIPATRLYTHGRKEPICGNALVVDCCEELPG